jgi:hypothetical protein
MAFALVVLHSFAGYSVGETITDLAAIEDASANYPAHVVRKFIPDAPRVDDEQHSLELPETPALKA